eukprot:TRINITY_DN13407_c0_g1_i1.p1 TRINITY_DN13407_c0_g1~~TRINITY_DN13407_c0_g1_i1.p1  ORF type:complete len:217 (-),score=46.87 TRINITY_DN13407_c0_g1_i1:23-643(-)
MSEKKKEKESSGSLAEQAKRSIASKAATSTLGKKLLTKVMNDDANNLMKAMKKLIEYQTDKKRATDIQNTIIRLLVKAHRQIEAKKLKEEQFALADRPLRKTFRRILRMTAEYDQLKNEPEKMKENFAALESYLREVQKIVLGLLDPYLSDKNKAKFNDTINFLSAPDFLTKVWADSRSKPEITKMCSAMEKYLQYPSRAPKETAK